ncbi:MAG: NADH-quinone oxidoreductase subunit C [Cyclobacteriaceae bacterium]|nr:NADH-quinone oxidoreductase subunit C [Cyclobacteriaceae bacterium]
MLEEIQNILKSSIDDNLIIEADESSSPPTIVVQKENLLAIASLLYKHEQLYFDMLSCITGIDNGAESESMEVIYNFFSIPFERSLMVKVILEREGKLEVPSLVEIWKTADWQEREVYDLFGIHFRNHPDMRRILMPADWEGHPLRKDYEDPEKYRGMNVIYDRDEKSQTFENEVLNTKSQTTKS